MGHQLVPQHRGSAARRMEPRSPAQLGLPPGMARYLVKLAGRLAAGQRTLTPLTVVRVHPRHPTRVSPAVEGSASQRSPSPQGTP